jgi:hypothetical protein
MVHRLNYGTLAPSSCTILKMTNTITMIPRAQHNHKAIVTLLQLQTNITTQVKCNRTQRSSQTRTMVPTQCIQIGSWTETEWLALIIFGGRLLGLNCSVHPGKYYEDPLKETMTTSTYLWFTILNSIICHYIIYDCRTQWPRGLRYELSSLARTLGSWVRIPLKAWISAIIMCLCCPVYVAALLPADPPSKESYRLCMGSRNWKSSQGPTKGCRAITINHQLHFSKMVTSSSSPKFFTVSLSYSLLTHDTCQSSSSCDDMELLQLKKRH